MTTIKQDHDHDHDHDRRGIVLYMRAQISGSSTNYSNKSNSNNNNLRSTNSATRTPNSTTTKGKVVLINPPQPSVIITPSSSSSSSSSSSPSSVVVPSLYLHPRTFLQRFICLILSVVLLRRHAVLLLAPLFYVSGMLFYMGNINNIDTPFLYNYILLPSSSASSSSSTPPLPGSRYRSPEAFQRFLPQMDKNPSFTDINANASSPTLALVSNVWTHSNGGGYWKPCLGSLNSSRGFQESNGFIVIEANGGLNQQRSSICNAVAVASLLNATLVIPKFHLNSVWKDTSSFRDIYDEEHFISSLAHRVRVVKQIPDYIMERYEHNLSLIHNFKVKAWAPSDFYQETVLPKLLQTGILRISPFANRLSYREVTPGIQQLRCFANFESLRFAEPITVLGEKLVQRMKEKSARHGGKYVAVHLRFEEDMVAFSCCVYDGGEEEKHNLDAAREKGWRGKFRRPGRVIEPDAIRRNGKCPMTPLEVGLMLRGMGFHNDTPIFIAAGKIYKSEQSMAPLRQMFPFLYTKDTLLSAEELEPFKNFSSRLAALDYTVCLHSEVFVTTQGGNFPQFLIGHRRYLHNGHSMTIKPDKRKLAVLLDTPEIGWEMFAREMQAMKHHSNFKGHELRKPDASIYTYPSPDCMCSEN